MPHNSDILNVKQMAKYLGIGINAAYKLVHQDGFPSLRIGKRIVISKTQLDYWVEVTSKLPWY